MAMRLRLAAPYVLGLLIAAVLFVLAGQITYPARSGQLGPDFWPRVAIGLMAAVCIYQIARAVLVGDVAGGVQAVAEHLDDEVLDAEQVQRETSPRTGLLLGGIGLTLAYAVLVPILGFLLASYLFLIAFMYLGGMRSHAAIWSASTIGILAFALIFLKIVYISIPRGQPPFDQVTQFVMDILFIR